MDISFLGESSQQLVSRSEESKQNISNCNLRESLHQVGDKSCASLLLESLRSKESQRLKIKMEREANNREDLIGELKEKCQELKRELQKSRNNVKCLSEENKQLKKIVQTLRRGIEQKKLTVQKQSSRLYQSNKHKEEEMKQSLLTLSQEKEKLRSGLSLLTKQNQITIKRLQFQLEETKSQLNSKVTIKEKQLLKIQELFENKKRQFYVSLNQKEQEIQHLQHINSDLTFQIGTLTSELNKSYEDVSLLESKTNELQNLYQNEFMKFKCEIDKIRESNDQEKLSHKQLLNEIQSSLKDFDLQFQIQPKKYESLSQHISYYTEKLKQKYKNSKESDEIAKARGQIQSLRNTELQLRSRINIIQQELDFTKKNVTKSQNIADIVKQHLNNNQQKMQSYDKENLIIKKYVGMQKFGGSLQKDQLHSQIQSLIVQAKQFNSSDLEPRKRIPLHEFNKGDRNNRFTDERVSKTHSRSQSKTIINKHKEETCIIPCFSQRIQKKMTISPTNEISNDDREFNNLKAELTTKKKSLIYMMYKGEEQRTEETKPVRQRSSRHISAITPKQRSCSMGELVRRRCLEHLQ